MRVVVVAVLLRRAQHCKVCVLLGGLRWCLQAVVVAVLFNAHSIEVLEDALDALSKEQLPFLGTTVLPWVTKALDSARQRMAQGRPMVS